MKKSSVYDCTMIELSKHHRPQGNISVVENGKDVLFDVKRAYYLYDVPGGESRGGHRQYIPRETLRRVSTPQAYQFKRLNEAYHEAFEKEIGIYGSAYTNTMMVELGETLHFAAGSDKNIKLTTKDDLEMFKSYLRMDKNSWLK